MGHTTNKRLVLIGTAHEFQRDSVANPWREEFAEMLRNLIEIYSTQIILEEWGTSRGTSVGKRFESNTLEWRSIQPPQAHVFSTEAPRIGPSPGPEVPFHLSLTQYPFEPHESREIYMASGITHAMEAYSQAVVILGIAHIHSMMGKLRVEGFTVIAGHWLQACDKGQKIMQACEPPTHGAQP